MPKVFTSKTQKIGELGEDIAVRYLERKGYLIVERNYTKKWGEIDIVAKYKNKIYFIEVKSKTVRSLDEIKNDSYNPAENMHYKKQLRTKRTIQTYLLERRVNIDWQFDLALVFLEMGSRIARVNLMQDIIL